MYFCYIYVGDYLLHLVHFVVVQSDTLTCGGCHGDTCESCDDHVLRCGVMSGALVSGRCWSW